MLIEMHTHPFCQVVRYGNQPINNPGIPSQVLAPPCFLQLFHHSFPVIVGTPLPTKMNFFWNMAPATRFHLTEPPEALKACTFSWRRRAGRRWLGSDGGSRFGLSTGCALRCWSSNNWGRGLQLALPSCRLGLLMSKGGHFFLQSLVVLFG